MEYFRYDGGGTSDSVIVGVVRVVVGGKIETRIRSAAFLTTENGQ